MNQMKWQGIKSSVVAVTVAVMFSGVVQAEQIDFKQSVDEALANNPEMTVSQGRILQAESALDKAVYSRLPQITLSVIGSQTNNALGAFGMKLQQQSVVNADMNDVALNNPVETKDFNTRVEVKLPIWNGGKIGSYQSQAEEMIQAAKQGDVAVRQYLTFSVYQAYESVHAAQAHIQVAEQAKKTADAFVKTTQNLVDQGVVVRSELLSAKVHQSKAEAALMEAQSQEQIALHGLKVLMNAAQDKDVSVAERVNLQLPADSVDALIEMALAANPGLKALRKEADSAKYATKAARADYFPNLNVMMRQDWNDKELALNNSSYTVAAVASWKVTDFGVTSSQVDMANAEAIQKRAKAQSEENQVRLAILTDWKKMEIAKKRVQTNELAVEQATEARDLIMKRYQSGVATVTEVLSSQTQLDKTKADLVSAVYDLNIYKAKLRLATGTMDVSQL